MTKESVRRKSLMGYCILIVLVVIAALWSMGVFQIEPSESTDYLNEVCQTACHERDLAYDYRTGYSCYCNDISECQSIGDYLVCEDVKQVKLRIYDQD